MGRHFRFTQADLARAIRGAHSGGMIVAQVEIEPSGKIVLLAQSCRELPGPANPWDNELDNG